MVVTGAAFCTSDLAQPFTRRPTHIDYGGIFRRSTPRSRRSFCETLKTLAEVSSGTREEWLSDRLTDWYSRQVTTCREYQSISGQLTTSSTGGHLLLYLRCISAASIKCSPWHWCRLRLSMVMLSTPSCHESSIQSTQFSESRIRTLVDA